MQAAAAMRGFANRNFLLLISPAGSIIHGQQMFQSLKHVADRKRAKRAGRSVVCARL